MKEIIDILMDQSIVGYLATVDNGKPRVRPWGFMYEDSGRLYFCTASTKDSYRQLQETPYVEYSKTTGTMAWVRVSGEVVFDESLEKKARCFEMYPQLKGLYQSEENPLFKVFYIAHGEAVLSGFPPNQSQSFTF